MRSLLIPAALLAPNFAHAQTDACQPNAFVTITTPTITYYRVTLIGEETAAGTPNWILKSDSGTISVPKSVITKCEAVGPKPEQPSVQSDLAQKPSQNLQGVELRLHGSNTIGAKFAPELAKAYAAKNGLTDAATKLIRPEEYDVEYGKAESDKKYVFHFQTHGSATAFQSLLGSAADIGMASRRVNAKEVAALQQAGFGNMTAAQAENVIALDGVVVIVNKDSAVQSLTLDQIARIFAGEITTWDKVGGKPGQITLYSRDDKSGTFDTFKNLVLESGKKRALSPSAKLFENSEELSDAVAADPGGIGFIGFAYIRGAKPLAISTTCGLEFSPEPFSVRTEEYPLSRRLFFYVPDKSRTASVNDFMRYVLSADAQPVTAAAGFIGLDIEESSRNYVLERGQYSRLAGTTTSASAPLLMQNFSQRISNAVRLSTTFRFKTGLTDLDNRAIEDVGRLAAYIRATPGVAERIMLFGFADTVGNFDSNLALSRSRALQIADALGSQGISVPRGQIQGFGVIAPVACSDSDNALEKNRRVEVWLRH